MKPLPVAALVTSLMLAATVHADTDAGAERREAAARALAERTAQAMRQEGVAHLIPPLRSPGRAARPAASAPSAVSQANPGLTRADVMAELARARRAGEMDFAVTELGWVSAPIGRAGRPPARESDATQLAALPSTAKR